jgi:probable F420-dependent oxidoreductase
VTAPPLSLNRLRFGFQTGTRREQVAALEALGVDSLWCGGHVASRNPTPETMTQLARLSALTERVTVGTATLTLPLYQPAVIAKQVADLDQATAGRLVLGVGVGGEYEQEFRACQVPVTERGGRTDEAIPLLRRLWSGEEITHTGRHFGMERVRMRPTPSQRPGPPIIVAGRRETAMRRAALLGDGWMPYLYSARRFADSVRTVTGLAAAAGRDLTGFHWMVYVFVNIDTDATRARSDAAAFLGGNYQQDFEATLDHVAVVGTTDEVTTKLQTYVDAGARHFVFAPARRGDVLDVARRIVDEVVPRLQIPSAVAG